MLNENKKYKDEIVLIGNKSIEKALNVNPNTRKLLQELDVVFNEYPDIYLVGGIVRVMLLNIVGEGKVNENARDLDFVWVNPECNASPNKPNTQEEYSVFYGIKSRLKHLNLDVDVSCTPSIKSRLLNNDVSINQVMYRPNKLIVTKRALQDAYAKKIMPVKFSNYEYTSSDERGEHDAEFKETTHEKFVDLQVAMRSTLFALRYGKRLSKNILETIKKYKPNDFYNDEYWGFMMYVHLKKAIQLDLGVQFLKVWRFKPKEAIHPSCVITDIIEYNHLNVWNTDLPIIAKGIVYDYQRNESIVFNLVRKLNYYERNYSVIYNKMMAVISHWMADANKAELVKFKQEYKRQGQDEHHLSKMLEYLRSKDPVHYDSVADSLILTGRNIQRKAKDDDLY